MSIRKNRRALMAELLLLADPIGIRIHSDGNSLAIDFDSIAELRSWLNLARLNAPDLLTGEREGTFKDGQPYRTMTAYPTWHGWDIYATATETTEPAAALDALTADKLAVLVVA